MEIAKSQTLTVISCKQQITSVPKSPLRTEFLCCFFGHNHLILRPPAAGNTLLRYHRRRKFRVQRNNAYKSQRILIKASLDSNSVTLLVVAFSVLSVAYFYHYVNNKKNNQKKSFSEVLSSPSFALPLSVGNIVNQIIDNRFLYFGDLHEVDSRESVEKAKFEENETYAQFQEDELSHDSPLSVKTLESSGANYVASSVVNDVVLKELEVISATVSALPSVLNKSDSTLDKSGKEAVFYSKSSEPVVKAKSSTVLVPVNNESSERSDFSLCYGVIKEAVREDIYTFYGANQSALQSVSNLGFKEESSYVFLPKCNSYVFLPKCKVFSSLKVNPALEREDLSAQHSLQAADYVGKTAPIAQYEGRSSHKSKSFEKTRGRLKNKERKGPILDNHLKLPQPPNLDGTASKEKDHHHEEFDAYNHLLREGRLAECVDLLEDMESKGLLDMNKVYHAKFLTLCRSQNAVKQAFRFCKLIQNPSMSTFNMLMSVCASSQDSEGSFQVLKLAKAVGLKADCKLYTTLISTCAKCGKVDTMFEVFHEMVNAGVEPNVHTYGALIDGCARAGQVAKAFGAYGIMRSKNVKPDRVVFNALITACGQSGAVDRAFDVLAEMIADEAHPMDPDYVTVGALIMACGNAGQIDRAQEVYNMVHEYNIKGTPEVYTIAVNCCSQTGDWDFACRVYDDMTRKGVVPDEMFFSALIDVAGHAGKVDAAFQILHKARAKGTRLGIMPYSSLMGACSNAKNWQKGLELYKDIKSMKLKPTIATMNALITALCDGNQLPKALEVLSEMKTWELRPNTVTYSILLVASERKDDLEVGRMLLSQAKRDGVAPNLVMYKCIIGMCLRRFEKACTLGEPVFSHNSRMPQIENNWTSLALTVYREAIATGERPTMEVVSQVLGCLQLPYDSSLKSRLVENLGVTAESSRWSDLCSLVDGFGEYDPRAFSLFEEAASLGIVPFVSFKESPIFIDARKLQIHIAEVYFLTILKGLKHRLAAGAKLPNVTILLPIEKTQVVTSEGEKMINVAGRISQGIASLLRRLGIPYQGNESHGRIRINGISLRRWLQPKLASPFSGKLGEWSSYESRIGKGIIHQQRNIRTGNLFLE